MIFNPTAALRRLRERAATPERPYPPLRVLLWSELQHAWRRVTGRR